MMILIDMCSFGLLLTRFEPKEGQQVFVQESICVDFSTDVKKAISRFQDLFHRGEELYNSIVKEYDLSGEECCTFNPAVYESFQQVNHNIKFVERELYSDVYFESLDEKISQLFDSKDSYNIFNRQVAIEVVKSKLRSPLTKDLHLIQALKAVDDLTSIVNLFSNRVQEWYAVHFPELSEIVGNNPQFLRLVTTVGQRKSFGKDILDDLSETKSLKIREAAINSVGKEMDSSDFIPLRQLAEFALETDNTKNRIHSYIEKGMEKIAPNLTELLGYKLACRLVVKAGSLKNLAMKPSSTIQIYGAEAALFRHMKTGTDPPKHGIIFQSDYIHGSKKHLRGRIARLLAGKISVAARVDFFSGEFIAPALKEDLEQKIARLEQEIPEKVQKKRSRKGKKLHKKRSSSRGLRKKKGEKRGTRSR
ncbi:MAG: NOP5/NOP56 family protein [Candidatus Hodarchaeales archaeon]|jgi:nucleolar protein 56